MGFILGIESLQINQASLGLEDDQTTRWPATWFAGTRNSVLFVYTHKTLCISRCLSLLSFLSVLAVHAESQQLGYRCSLRAALFAWCTFYTLLCPFSRHRTYSRRESRRNVAAGLLCRSHGSGLSSPPTLRTFELDTALRTLMQISMHLILTWETQTCANLPTNQRSSTCGRVF